ncbi:hypothetical protein GB931_01265 [Modestobacter sp. I12A-02628]|uniref:Uncharacterized protein n=1 Tax=Goekera deserti TaxID=2497753 RepID=A0A7K3WGJ6_9ACTN|nr:hypothetical protein [Goekera deserti]MPQ96572.1 hypothetical protein [Goekera deserti]NDI47116.1 hypothetical protein [Goekera deserti]NEL55486.1 hypothetical protein [Goekera deserti]
MRLFRRRPAPPPGIAEVVGGSAARRAGGTAELGPDAARLHARAVARRTRARTGVPLGSLAASAALAGLREPGAPRLRPGTPGPLPARRAHLVLAAPDR